MGDEYVSDAVCEARTKTIETEVRDTRLAVDSLAATIRQLDGFMRNGISSAISKHDVWIKVLASGGLAVLIVLGWMILVLVEISRAGT